MRSAFSKLLALVALLALIVGVDVARATEQFANTASSTINHGGGYTSGATSIVLTSTATFPSSGNFRVKETATGEIMLVTANNTGTNTLTVTRAQESTSAATINNGDTVTHVLTAGALGQLKADAFTAGGDLTGSATSQTVAQINGASVPAAGSLTSGNVLKVSGVSSLSYGAVNLAGGSNHVTGTLPIGNHPNFWWSMVDQGVARNTTESGNFTVGMEFRFLNACTWSGVRWFGVTSGSKNWKVRAHDLTAASALATATCNTLASGTNTCSFSTPVSITSVAHDYVVSAYETSGSNFAGTSSTDDFFNVTGLIGPNVWVTSDSMFAAGDAQPTAGGSSQRMTVEPVFTVP